LSVETFTRFLRRSGYNGERANGPFLDPFAVDQA
jgi:hypothetical protein